MKRENADKIAERLSVMRKAMLSLADITLHAYATESGTSELCLFLDYMGTVNTALSKAEDLIKDAQERGAR